MNDTEAKQRTTDALIERFVRELNLVQVDRLPAPVYGFNPDGWTLFILNGADGQVSADEYVAINRETAKVRFLGVLGL